jgi:hypothetical protein
MMRGRARTIAIDALSSGEAVVEPEVRTPVGVDARLALFAHRSLQGKTAAWR